MKFVISSLFADPDAAARKLVEIANAIEAVQDGRIHVGLINASFLDAGGSPAEYIAPVSNAQLPRTSMLVLAVLALPVQTAIRPMKAMRRGRQMASRRTRTKSARVIEARQRMAAALRRSDPAAARSPAHHAAGRRYLRHQTDQGRARCRRMAGSDGSAVAGCRI